MALLTAALGLAGCSGAGNVLPSLGGGLPGWFGGDRAAAPVSPGEAAPATLDDDCPSVDIRRGASTLAIATKTEGATANDLRYQLTFNQTARQCSVLGTTVRMRVGVQGRVVVGPAGAPAQVTVPIRYAVVREGVEPVTIATKLHRFPLAVPPDVTNLLFTDIEEDLSFPMPPLEQLQTYVVYVGYDDIADRPARPAKKGPARPKSASAPR
jgi:hypothetical protein